MLAGVEHASAQRPAARRARPSRRRWPCRPPTGCGRSRARRSSRPGRRARRPRRARRRTAGGCQVPNSSPSVSSNHQTCSPSGDSAPSLVPCGRSVTCRVVPVRPVPGVELEGAAWRSRRTGSGRGRRCAHSGRLTRGARKRRSQAGRSAGGPADGSAVGTASLPGSARRSARGVALGSPATTKGTGSRRCPPRDCRPPPRRRLVGVTGFEPATSASRTQRATKLRHTPEPCADEPTGRRQERAASVSSVASGRQQSRTGRYGLVPSPALTCSQLPLPSGDRAATGRGRGRARGRSW